METPQEKKYRQMTESPIGPLILRLAIPCIISMLVTAFYNMADTFFAGMLNNNSATGAVGVVYSVMALIQAIGFFFGQGSGSFISRELGSQNRDAASKMVATGFSCSLLFGIVVMLIGLLFLDPLTRLLGSTETIFPYARSYLRIILLGTPWMSTALVLNNQLRFQGNAVYGMAGITTGALLNIVLDPLLIFVCNMGVSGAALATVISQFISFCILLAGTARGSNLHIRLSQTQFQWEYLKNIFRGGFPSLARQSLASIATISLNLAAKEYGDVAIAAMSVTQRIMMFGASAMLGFGQGFQPFCGFNYGARRYRRVIQGFWFSVKISSLFLLGIGALGFLYAPHLIAIFRDDPQVIACGTVALRAQCVTLFTHAFLVMSNMMLQTTGRAGPATFLSMARQGLFFLPLILILPLFLDLTGVQIAQAVADCFAAMCAVLVQRRTLKQLSTIPEPLS